MAENTEKRGLKTIGKIGLGAGAVVGIAFAFQRGFKTGFERAKEEFKSIKTEDPDDDVVEIIGADPDEVPEEIPQPEVVKVVELPSIDGIYEGEWYLQKTGKKRIDRVLGELKEEFDQIGQEMYDSTSIIESFEDAAYSICSGLYTYKDDIKDHLEELYEMSKIALESYDSEENANIELDIALASIIRDHREQMYRKIAELNKSLAVRFEKPSDVLEEKEVPDETERHD